MLSPVLSFRPPTVLGRLPPHSDACPLSLRDILGAAGEGRLPMFDAGSPELIRAVLIAAKVFRSTVGLSIPRGLEPERWFDSVARSADELAAALPLFLSAEVALGGESTVDVERATQEVWRLMEAGLTHLVLDASGASPEERGRVLAEVAAPLQERALGFDCAVTLGEQGAGRRTLALVEELARDGVPVGAISVRCPAPGDVEAARAQLGALDRLAEALQGVPLFRRGPVSAPLLAGLSASRVRGCSDGGLVASAAARPAEEEVPGPEAAERRARWRDRARAALGDEAERLEAEAFLAAAAFLDAVGSEQSATRVAHALERQRSEGGA